MKIRNEPWLPAVRLRKLSIFTDILDIETLLKDAGLTFERVRITRNRQGKSLRTALVLCTDPEHLQPLVDFLHMRKIDGRRITATFAHVF